MCFENSDEARRACQKDRETFGEKWGERYVRVYPTLESDVSDMQQAVSQQNMVATSVRLRAPGGRPRQRASSGGSNKQRQQRLQRVQLQAGSTWRASAAGKQQRWQPASSSSAAQRRSSQHQRLTLPAPSLCSPQGGHGHHMDSVIKLKSLPFDASQLDIIMFFEGFKLKPNGVQLVVRSDNKPTGEVSAQRPRQRRGHRGQQQQL